MATLVSEFAHNRISLVPPLLGLLKSTALYAFLLAPISVLLLGIDFADAREAALNPNTLAGWFMHAALVALLLPFATMVIDILQHTFWRVFRPNRPGKMSLAELMLGRLWVAIIQPIHGVRAVVGGFTHDRVDGSRRPLLWQVESWIHFLWAIALFGYLAVGFISVRFGTVA
ncbi:MAG: hypothetical protein QM655_03955 [Nocardioidaceae bacterium]